MRLAHAIILSVVLVTACGSAKPTATPAPDPQPAPLLIHHARLMGSTEQSDILVARGRISAVGPVDHVRAQAPQGVQELDVAGARVLPGFHDSHVHLMLAGMAALSVDLSGAGTIEQVLGAVKEWAAQHPDSAWIVGHGWQYGIVPPGQLPTRQHLDSVIKDRPVFLVSYDGHTGWANTKALGAAGIGAGTTDPADGRIAREADGKTAQGALLEGAQGLMMAALPRPAVETQLKALESAVQDMLHKGYTSVENMAADPAELELLRALQEQGRLPLHVGVALPLGGDLDRYEQLRRQYSGENIRVAFLKGFLDGVIESRTAWMLQPYEGTTERGKPLMTVQELNRRVEAAHARGFAVALHAVGDASVRAALDAFEAAIRKHPAIKLRHRIEHMEVVDPADLSRFKQLDVIASMQPYHANPGGPNPDDGVWARNLGAQRLKMSFAWRSVLDAGAPLAFGTDWPVMSNNPLWGLALAITRKSEQGLPTQGWNAQQTIAPEQAVEAFTRGSAYAVGLENAVGAMKPGQRADLVVLAPGVDIREASTLWQGKPTHVVVGGVLHSLHPHGR